VLVGDRLERIIQLLSHFTIEFEGTFSRIYKELSTENLRQYPAHPFFRASFPNLVVLVNHWWNVAGHPRSFPKWYILYGTFTIFSAFCLTFHTILTHSG
jgi:hypothetical protein